MRTFTHVRCRAYMAKIKRSTCAHVDIYRNVQWSRGGPVFEALVSLSLRLKDVLGPVTRVKKKQKKFRVWHVCCRAKNKKDKTVKRRLWPWERGDASKPPASAASRSLIRTSVHHKYAFPQGIGAIPSEIRLTAPMPRREIVFMMNSRRDDITN